MKGKLRKFLLVLLIFNLWASIVYTSDLKKKLNKLPEVTIEKMKSDSLFTECYKIMLTQPLDHSNPDAGTFNQRILLSHLDFSHPVVLITEGYSVYHNYLRELSEILNTNQIRIEHRFFGESKPDTMDWKYLNITQAAADHHRVVELFKEIYPEQWINTGWSKGGQTALIHRWKYPEDVDITVAYDAPLNFSLEDKRIDQFFDQVGTQECRDKLIEFQRAALERKDDILPRFKWYTIGRGYEYPVGLEKAYEYIVLEYPFSFWQYHTMYAEDIPAKDAPADSILEHLRKVVSFSSYSERAMNSAAMYQFSTQLGYYGYVRKKVEDLLQFKSHSNTVFAPQNTELNYDPELMRKLNLWLQENGDHILYIYAGRDPWSAPQVVLSGKTEAKKFILKDGNHFTFINTFPERERTKIIRILKEWLGSIK